MARKAIRGYTEKSYYDNNTFKGIVTSTDAMAEGTFAHMVNFDIADTNGSLTPRCGFLTTDIVLTDPNVDTIKLNADSTLYFYAPNISKYIFIDFSTFIFTTGTEYSINAYKVNFGLEEFEGITNKRFTAEKILNIDMSDIFTFLDITTPDARDNIQDLIHAMKFSALQAEHAKDEYTISKYISKVIYPENFQYPWIGLYYRAQGSTYEGTTYSEDTLVVSYLDTEQTMSINTADRNIASTKSVIPDPMQHIYEHDSNEISYNQFPLIYVKENNTDKYLINTSKDSNVTFVPHFLIKDFDTKTNSDIPMSTWAYAYKFTSTAYYPSTDTMYTSGVYGLKDGKTVPEIWANAFNLELSKFNQHEMAHPNIQLDYYSSKVDYFNITSMYFYYLYYTRCRMKREQSLLWAADLASGYLPPSEERKNHNESHRAPEYIGPGRDSFKDTSLDKYLSTLENSNYSYFNNSNFNNSVLIYVIPKLSSYSFEDYIQINNNTTCRELPDFLRFVFTNATADNISTYSSNDEAIKNLTSLTSTTIDELINLLQTPHMYTQYRYIVIPYKDIVYNYNIDGTDATDNLVYTDDGIFTRKHFAFFSGIAAFRNILTDTIEAYKLVEYLKAHKDITNISFKFMRAIYPIRIGLNFTFTTAQDWRAEQFLPHYSDFESLTRPDNLTYYFITADTPIFDESEIPAIGDVTINPDSGSCYKLAEMYKGYFFRTTSSYLLDTGEILSFNDYASIPILHPIVANPIRNDSSDTSKIFPFDTRLWEPHTIQLHNGATSMNQPSHFTKSEGLLSLNMSQTDLYDLRNKGYFDTGINMSLYLIPLYMPTTFLDMLSYDYNNVNPTTITSATYLYSTRQISYSPDPSYMIETLTEEPRDIRQSTKFIVFSSDQGDRIVTWVGNKVYISEPNSYYYYKSTNVHTYPERVLKVIQFKNTLLVFTPLNLYSIYPYEDVQLSSGVDEEGNATTIQTTVIYYATLPVLYNLMLTEQYLDAIQVFNQMVLFYSADGQLFMIKPTATIDNDTKFSIQYFNKSANNILLNYDQYMQSRLHEYGIDTIVVKSDVTIKVQVNINYIKIFYMYDDYTYILVYDIINNYYYTYDTLSFTDIKNIIFTSEGDTYISTTTLSDDKKYLFFTVKNNIPNEMDNNVDEAVYNSFKDTPICTEIDTGNLNLNNHLKKRFRDLHTVYKNLTAKSLLFILDTFIDDIPAQVSMDDSMTIVSSQIGGEVVHNYECVSTKIDNELLEDNNALFDFSDFTSNKILTYYSSIPCLGKHFRMRMRFVSKGKYKIQSYGITFKEHQI